MLDKSKNDRQNRNWNKHVGNWRKLFLSSNNVSKDGSLSKALSVILLILLSDNFNIWRFFNMNVSFPIACILFFDKSNINNDSSPMNAFEAMLLILLLDMSIVSKTELFTKRRSGSVIK